MHTTVPIYCFYNRADPAVHFSTKVLVLASAKSLVIKPTDALTTKDIEQRLRGRAATTTTASERPNLCRSISDFYNLDLSDGDGDSDGGSGSEVNLY